MLLMRRGFVTMTSLLLLFGVAMTGCAKRPATTQAAAPAPTGATGATAGGTSGAGMTTAQPTSSGPGGATSGTQTPGGGTQAVPATSRPSPVEFKPVPELRDIHFDFDKYDIRPNDAKTLDANAAWLKSNPGHLVLIEGHCDERGTNEYNLALGERRAKSTMNYLVSQGVQANRITIISYGEERPACTEKTEECWARNRRAHFLVKPR
ncbi:MAG TPA: peptidoglycan-associated lipoprotein Pal [Candidatus Tectomicrobia bacterium]|nr:peptidoglycan-associated lipoprotein Pal [Candidatus Tectomicrobia bacterium]